MNTNSTLSILDLIKQERELMKKKAFQPPTPPQGGGAAPMPPPQGAQPPAEPAPAPMGDQAGEPPAPSQEEGKGDENKDVIQMLEKMGEDLDKKQIKIDALEQRLNEQNGRVSELYGNIAMLLNIIEKGNASGAISKPKV